MSQLPSEFTSTDLSRIERATFLARIEYHQQLDSTNNLALELAADEDITLPLLVLTERQTAGRGRGSNQWWATRGALTFSLIVETSEHQLPQKSWPRVSLSVGLAVCEALAQLAPQADLGIKWPNDVFLDGRKLCGVLVEVPGGRSDRLVIGIGINVNNSFHAAPPELQPIATSLFDSTRRAWPLPVVLAAVLNRLETRIGDVASVNPVLTSSWRERCILTGSTVTLKIGENAVTGECLGIDDDGALLMKTADGRQRHFAGVIEIVPQDSVR